MLRSLEELEGLGLQAVDGELGKTKDYYFDDVTWTVRYAVVDTGKWLPGRRVLISPASFEGPDEESSSVPTRLTREQIRAAPSVAEDLPVSRQREAELARHYSWPEYWATLSGGAVLAGVDTRTGTPKASSGSRADGDPHLRSRNELRGYRVQSLDGDVGSVADFIVDTNTWKLQDLVVDTQRLLPGGKVLVSLNWIESVRWNERTVNVDLEKAMVQACPSAST